jgi:gametolysin peptidase M11
MRALRRTAVALASLLAIVALVAPAAAWAATARVLEGTLSMAHGDTASGSHMTGSGTWDYRLATSGGTVRLAFSGPGGKGPDGFLNGAHVKVRGTLSNGVLAVGGSKADAQVSGAVTVQAPVSKRIALLLVNFTGNPVQPWTLAQAAGIEFTNADSVANYFAEESYGKVAVTGDVFGWYTLSINESACDFTDIGNKANAAATAAGVNLANYTNIQYAFPNLSACGWSGLAYVPGTQTWLNNALQLGVSAHELSHNFGVHHASTVDCYEGGVRVSISANLANCSFSEYGDPFSVMGNAWGNHHTHTQQLAQMGWASGSELVTATTTGDYNLGSAESSASPVKALRVSRGDGTYLYLELRQPFGTYFDAFNAGDPVVNGVSVRYSNDWTTIVQSKLIDTTPATTTFSDAALAPGRSFTDPVSGVTVTTVSIASGTAVVHLDWGPDTIAPSQPGTITVTKTGTYTAQLTWGASTDNRGVTSYQVTRDGALVGTVSTTTFADGGPLNPGTTYQYAVTAFDGAGNASTPQTKSWTQPVPDTTAPTWPAGTQLTATVTKAKTTFSWVAASDNVGVTGYRVYRGTTELNAVLVATTTARTWSDPRQRTAYVYYVVAYDAAGNVSAHTNTVAVPRK